MRAAGGRHVPIRLTKSYHTRIARTAQKEEVRSIRSPIVGLLDPLVLDHLVARQHLIVPFAIQLPRSCDTAEDQVIRHFPIPE